MEDRKVAYETLGGFRSTAYLDFKAKGEPNMWFAENKHTDGTVLLEWTGDGWVERSFHGIVNGKPIR